MFNVFIALLVEQLVLTQKEGEVLAKELSASMLPSEFREAQKLVRKIKAKV